jgi:hypothetical protein
MSLEGSEPVHGETSAQEASELAEEISMAGIDLQALAEKVYRLLKEELRIERDRLGLWD